MRIFKIVCIVAVLFVLAVCLTTAYYFFVAPIKLQNTTTIRLKHGDSFPVLVSKLSGSYDIKSRFSFKLWMRLTNSAQRVQAGEYALQSGMTLNQLRHKLISGDVVTYHITFVEGVKFSGIMQQLFNNKVLKHDLNKQFTPSKIMQLVAGVNSNPEGRFFPDTYSYHWGDSDLDILRRAHNRMTKVLQSEWNNRAEGLWYKNSYQALIVASLLQVETAQANELPQVASVILNRLKIRMRLQVDPTVMYGLGHDFGYTLSKSDLRRKTAYNTYRIYGLPPTPIDMPGRAAIHAALHPAQTDFLYYVSRNDGSHKFSATYAEHLRAVDKFQRNKNSTKNKQGEV